MAELITNNCWYGRRSYKPIAIVLHVTEGSGLGAYAWCKNPNSNVSYHEIIDEMGDTLALVDGDNTAWHAGLAKNATWSLIKHGLNPNYYTIGIAYAGYAAVGPSQIQLNALAARLRYYSRRYNISLDEQHVIGHNQIRSDKLCPGPKLNIATLIKRARSAQ